MLKELLSSIKKHLEHGVKTKGHPFRYCTLSTVNSAGSPTQRTVVLRDVDTNLSLTIYTDKRSDKINHITTNTTVSLLFYDSRQLLQVVIEAEAFIITDNTTLESLWSTIPEKARKDYTTKQEPGGIIENPSEVSYLTENNHFVAIQLIPTSIDYLKLSRPAHIRARFDKKDNEWKGHYLNP